MTHRCQSSQAYHGCSIHWASWIQSLSQQKFYSKNYGQLQTINELEIPRHALCINHVKIELHGFSDASEKAYGGCLYLRSSDAAGNHVTHLLCAKSRVAPLNLIAALLTAHVVKRFSGACPSKIKTTYLWTDSTIVLAWISAEPQSWNTFVANLVSDIQTITNANQWHRVNSSSNPADLVSRGLSASDLIDNSLWCTARHGCVREQVRGLSKIREKSLTSPNNENWKQTCI